MKTPEQIGSPLDYSDRLFNPSHEKLLTSAQSVPFYPDQKWLQDGDTTLHPVRTIHVMGEGIDGSNPVRCAEVVETGNSYQLVLTRENGNDIRLGLYWVGPRRNPKGVDILPVEPAEDNNDIAIDFPWVVPHEISEEPLYITREGQAPPDLLLELRIDYNGTMRPLTQEEVSILAERNNGHRVQTSSVSKTGISNRQKEILHIQSLRKKRTGNQGKNGHKHSANRRSIEDITSKLARMTDAVFDGSRVWEERDGSF